MLQRLPRYIIEGAIYFALTKAMRGEAVFRVGGVMPSIGDGAGTDTP